MPRKAPEYAPIDPPAAPPTVEELARDGALTATKAAAFLGLGLTRFYELLNAKEIPSYYEGPHRMIPLAALRGRIAAKLRGDS